jgi:hypothetical protein
MLVVATNGGKSKSQINQSKFPPNGGGGGAKTQPIINRQKKCRETQAFLANLSPEAPQPNQNKLIATAPNSLETDQRSTSIPHQSHRETARNQNIKPAGLFQHAFKP